MFFNLIKSMMDTIIRKETLFEIYSFVTKCFFLPNYKNIKFLAFINFFLQDVVFYVFKLVKYVVKEILKKKNLLIIITSLIIFIALFFLANDPIICEEEWRSQSLLQLIHSNQYPGAEGSRNSVVCEEYVCMADLEKSWGYCWGLRTFMWTIFLVTYAPIPFVFIGVTQSTIVSTQILIGLYHVNNILMADPEGQLLYYLVK